MATSDDFYTSPDYQINREACVGEIGGAASTVYGKFHAFAKIKLKAVHVRVTVAGTSATHAINVYIGTASVASTTLGTSTAGVTATIAVGSNVNSLQAVELKTGDDAAGKVVASYEYEYQQGASMTV